MIIEQRTNDHGSDATAAHDASIPLEQLSQHHERQNHCPADDSSSNPQRGQASKESLQERIERLETRLQDIQSPPVLLNPGPASTSHDRASDFSEPTETGWSIFRRGGIFRRSLKWPAICASYPVLVLWNVCYMIRDQLLPDYQGRYHCARYYGGRQFKERLSQAQHIGSSAAPIYLIIGIFKREDMVPYERFAQITRPRRLFWTMSYHIMRLRRMGGIFSLKDVKKFRIYKVDLVFFPFSFQEAHSRELYTQHHCAC